MGWRVGRYLKRAIAVIGLVLGMVVVGLIPVSLSPIKELLQRFAQENLDVDLEIRGSFRLRLGPSPRVDAADIVIRRLGVVNEPLATIESLTVRPRLLSILQGDVHLQQIEISGVQFDYCAELPHADGEKTEPLPSIEVRRIQGVNLSIRCDRYADDGYPVVEIAVLSGSAPAEGSISATGHGRVNDLSVEFEAAAGNLNDLLSNPATFPLQLTVSAQRAEIHLGGAIEDPLDQFELNADVEVQAQNLKGLFADLGIDIPELEPLEAKARVRLDFDEVTIEELVGAIGDSRFDGRGLARMSSGRPYYDVDVHLDQLDLKLFQTATNDRSNVADQEQEDLSALFDIFRGIDAEAHVSIDHLANVVLPVEGVDVNASLADGSLTLSISHALVAGSPVEAEARLNMQGACADLQMQGRISGVDLKVLDEFLGHGVAVGGRVDQIEVRISSCGNTIVEHRNTASAEIDVASAVFRHDDLEGALILDTVTINAGWFEPSRAVLRGRFLDERLSVEAGGGTVEQLVSGSRWPIKLEADGAGAALMVVGSSAIVAGSISLDAQLSFNAPRLGALHRWLPVDSENVLPLSVSTFIEWADTSVAIDGLSASIGSSDIAGRLEWIQENSQPVLVTHLRSERLHLTELASVMLATEETAERSPDPEDGSDATDSSSFLEGLELPSIDLDIRIEQLDGYVFDMGDVELQGRLRNKLIDDARLRMRLEQTFLEGVIDVDLSSSSSSISYQASASNIDIAQLLAKLDLAPDRNIQAAHADLTYSSSGSTIRQIAVNSELQVDIQEFSWFDEKSNPESDFDLGLDRLVLTAAPGEPITFEASGLLNGNPVKAWATIPSLGEILERNARLPTKVVAGAGDDVIMLIGDIEWAPAEGFSGNLVLSGQRMDTEAVDFAKLKSPLKAFEFHTELKIGDEEISISDLNLSIGTSNASGNVSVSIGEDIWKFTVELQSPQIQTDDFVGLADMWRERGEGNSDVDAPADEEFRVFPDVLRDKIKALTAKNYFDIRIDVDEVIAGDQILGGAHLGVYADQNNVILQPFRVEFSSGEIDAEYSVTRGATGVDTALDIYIERLQYGDLLRLFDPDVDRRARGYLYLDTSLSSNATATDQILTAVQGDVELMIIPEHIEAGILDLWAGNLVFAVLPAPKDSAEPKKLNCMVATFSVDEGVMKARDVLLDSTDIIVRGRGTIDIGKGTLDMIAVPQGKREKFFSMSTPVTITGSWDDPLIGVAPGGLMDTLFRWYMSLIYVPYKWLTGERFPPDGLATCFNATEWEMPGNDD